ncbi:MAG TPA: hypothetical protein VEZ50_16950 [Nodosilinea sp.]|nr:hypothetical protein [Nodosilinea sp.]
MFQSTLFSALVKPFSSQGQTCDRRSLSYLLVGAATVAAFGAAAPTQAQLTTAPEVAQTAAASPAERHLFGQVAQPDQIGQGYMVVERSGDRVYGALYFPSSSFDCFHGQVEGTELAMTIINSYDQETYPYSVALADGPAVASSEAAGELAPFGLSGFFAIDTLSDNDHRMLDICRSAVAPN